jgi:hypothetical protein
LIHQTKAHSSFDQRLQMLHEVIAHSPTCLTYEQENVLMFGTPEVPGWAKDIPRNIGIPTCLPPGKCSACVTPIWRWNGEAWVCYNCKLYDIKYSRRDGDLSTLDGCRTSGYTPKPVHIDRSLPDHPCYHCGHTAWGWDQVMKNYRCNYCYPE